jgi:branched-chain amino acid transport system substrate-binding protein
VGVKIKFFFAAIPNFVRETISRKKREIIFLIIIISVAFFVVFSPQLNSALNYTRNIFLDSLDNKISLGEDAPLLKYDNRDKKYEKNLRQDVRTAFAKEDYEAAKKIFHTWYKKENFNPEALIYWLNVKALSESKKSGAGVLKIAVTVPASGSIDAAYEILRGVAKVQHKINEENNGINGKKLIVLIADDNNNETKAKEIAEKLVREREILAVVGSNKSEASLIAAKVYKKEGMTMISPTSDSSEFVQNANRPIFGTMQSQSTLASKLLEHINKNFKDKTIAICEDNSSNSSKAFHSELKYGIANIANKYKLIQNFNCNIQDKTFKPSNDKPDILVLLPGIDHILNAIDIAEKAKQYNGNIILLGSHTLNTYRVLCPHKPRDSGCQSLEGMVLPVPWNPGTDDGKEFLKEQETFWDVKLSWRSVMSYKATDAIVKGLQKLITTENIDPSNLPQYIDINLAEPILGNPSLIEVKRVQSQHRSFDFVPVNPTTQSTNPN